LAAPPAKGELAGAIALLAARTWRHPTSGEAVRFGFSTIELRRKLRANAGQQPAMRAAIRQAIVEQYAAHKSWSVQLHYDNLVALAECRSELRPVPSYDTLRRFLKANGLAKRRRLTSRRTEGAEQAEARLLDREVLSYEAEYVGGLGTGTVMWDRGGCSPHAPSW